MKITLFHGILFIGSYIKTDDYYGETAHIANRRPNSKIGGNRDIIESVYDRVVWLKDNEKHSDDTTNEPGAFCTLCEYPYLKGLSNSVSTTFAADARNRLISIDAMDFMVIFVLN